MYSKNSFKRRIVLVLVLLVALTLAVILSMISLTTKVTAKEKAFQSESAYTKLTLSQMPTPLIAGAATYDDFVINYTHGGDAVGFGGDYLNHSIETDIKFSNNAFPNWFSLTLRASGFDRTQSPNLAVPGYSLQFFNSGIIALIGNHVQLSQTPYTPFSVGTTYRIEYGTYDLPDGVQVFFKIDGVTVLDYFHADSAGAIRTPGFYTICGDGAVSATISSTERIISPYTTYTFDELKSPIIVDATGTSYRQPDGSVIYSNTGACIGFQNAYLNHSFVGSYRFSSFNGGNWISLSMRTSGVDRTQSVNLAEKGYSVTFYQRGYIELWKDGQPIWSAWPLPAFSTATDYIIEVGTVDMPGGVNVFAKVNGGSVMNYLDKDNPITTLGAFVMCGDGGGVSYTAKPYRCYLDPLDISYSENDREYLLESRFSAPFSLTSALNPEQEQMVLGAISLNNLSGKEINTLYTSNSGTQCISAQASKGNLILAIQKSMINKTTGAMFSLDPSDGMEVFFAKYKDSENGFITPSGLKAKRNFIFSNRNEAKYFVDESLGTACADHPYAPCLNSASCDNALCNLSVTLNVPDTLLVGETVALDYKLSHDNAIIYAVTYETDAAHADVSSDTLLTGVSEGSVKVTVRVTTPKGEFTSSKNVQVLPNEPSPSLPFAVTAHVDSDNNIISFDISGQPPIYSIKLLVSGGAERIEFLSATRIKAIKAGAVEVKILVNGELVDKFYFDFAV